MASVAFFAMPERGHFQLLMPLISGLCARGIGVHVFTDGRFEADVVAAGGAFVDLFGGGRLEAADAGSIPVPCRFVSFAGTYVEEVSCEVELLGADLVIYETFAVIGRVVARVLGVPYVNVCAGHNMDPARFLPALEADPRVSVSPTCRRAVEVLRERYDIEDASPFSYVDGLSPFLNVYCEPPAFLAEEERRAFEPLAFFGSLPSLAELEARDGGGADAWFAGGEEELKVYVSFGTVVWRYWAAEALDALRTIAGALAAMPGVRGVIDVKGAAAELDALRALAGPNVRVAAEVDQWQALRQADVFVTHHGLNSTHEAIFNEVAMVSYPFFSDQPALATRCQELGLAIALSDSPRAQLTREDVRAAVADVGRRGESMRASLARARAWELEAMAGRDAVLDRVVGLAG